MTLYNDPTEAIRRTELNTRSIATYTTSITVIGDGRQTVTTAGTRVALATTTTVKYVIITAETDNTGVIVVGGVTCVAALATRSGKPLNAGQTIAFPIDDLADVYIDSTVNTDGITFVYLA